MTTPGTRTSPRTRMAVLACAGAMGLLLAAPLPAAGTESAFVEELKADNAKHLDNPPDLPEPETPPALERGWEDKPERKEWEMREGAVSVRVTLKNTGPPDAALHSLPVVTVAVEGEDAITVEGSESVPDNPVFLVQIAEMDPSNPHPEVVFSSFTGGAHCCSDTRILSSTKDGDSWRETVAGYFDGGPQKVSDIDGDGRYEIAVGDNRFLYRFACYACSFAPLQVLRLEDGEMVDVSGAPEYRPRHVAVLVDAIEGMRDMSDPNGFLAGYVAQKIRLGEGAQAWDFMKTHYDRETDWGLEHCSVETAAPGDCPEGKTVTLTFPEALKRFLEKSGYPVPE